MQRHIDNKSCPASLRYSARANIPPDEQFKLEIKAVKQKAEQGFLAALTKFHYRRLEKQKTQLLKEKNKARVNGKNVKGIQNKSRDKPRTATEISIESLKRPSHDKLKFANSCWQTLKSWQTHAFTRQTRVKSCREKDVETSSFI